MTELVSTDENNFQLLSTKFPFVVPWYWIRVYRRDWPDEWPGRKRQMGERPCFSPLRSLNRSSCIHWEEASARMSSSTRHPAGSGLIEKSRTAGYLYLYGQLFNRTLKSADSGVAQAAAGKFSEPPPCFPYKAFDVRAFCHNFARPRLFPPSARTATRLPSINATV